MRIIFFRRDLGVIQRLQCFCQNIQNDKQTLPAFVAQQRRICQGKATLFERDQTRRQVAAIHCGNITRRKRRQSFVSRTSSADVRGNVPACPCSQKLSANGLPVQPVPCNPNHTPTTWTPETDRCWSAWCSAPHFRAATLENDRAAASGHWDQRTAQKMPRCAAPNDALVCAEFPRAAW